VRLPSWWNYETIGNAFNVLLVVSLLSAFGLAAVAAMPEEPQEYPGHRNVWADYEGLRDFDVRWTWYDTVAAHDFCNVVALDELHHAALKFLYTWHRGLLSDQQFLGAFGLPNSDYIEAAPCIIAQKAKRFMQPWTPNA
jgi:hypothetical protein